MAKGGSRLRIGASANLPITAIHDRSSSGRTRARSIVPSDEGGASVRIEALSDAELAVRPHRVRGPVAQALLDRGAIAPARAVGYAPDGADAQRDLNRAGFVGGRNS